MRPPRAVPDLRLVPTGSIRFHEHPERKRTLKLVERIRDEVKLRNPPIVAELDDDAYVLLDGANRVSAFADLGYSHVPVQVIDYGDEAVQLKGWHHLLVEGASLDLRGAYAGIDGVRLERVSREELASLIELRRVYAALLDETMTGWALAPAEGLAKVQLADRMAVLERVVAAYEGRATLERIKTAEFDNLPEVFESVEHQLVLFPTIAKFELMSLVRDDLMIPTGITRHLIPGRALGLNLPLGFLTELADGAAKEDHFREFVEDLELRGRIRLYEESVFILNE